MNTKTILGVLALVVVAFGAYYGARLVRPSPTTTPLEVFQASATSAPATAGGTAGRGGTGAAGVPADPSKPSFIQGAPIKTTVHITLAFDKPIYTTADPYPMFGGTGGNVTSAQILVKDSNGVGIEAATISIKGGRWSYASPRALTPGNYTVWLGTQGLVVEAKLTITAT